MRQISILLFCLLLTTAADGCRSCASCHDYDPPVANCDCNAYGTQRAGSISGGYITTRLPAATASPPGPAPSAPENAPAPPTAR